MTCGLIRQGRGDRPWKIALRAVNVRLFRHITKSMLVVGRTFGTAPENHFRSTATTLENTWNNLEQLKLNEKEHTTNRDQLYGTLPRFSSSNHSLSLPGFIRCTTLAKGPKRVKLTPRNCATSDRVIAMTTLLTWLLDSF